MNCYNKLNVVEWLGKLVLLKLMVGQREKMYDSCEFVWMREIGVRRRVSNQE